MKTKLLSFVFLCLISVSAIAKDPEPFNSVQELFAAMSAFDYKKMHSLGTKDFQLLEVGEVWTMKMLVDAVKPEGKPYVRRNYFELLRSEVSGDMAWVSYWNKARFGTGEDAGDVIWLESAVMIKQDAEWKIQMLHSTRLTLEKVPERINLKEYTKN